MIKVLSFRLKLLGAMMLVVAGSAAMTLVTLQRRVEAGYERLLQKQFDQAIAAFTAFQDARLESVKRRCRELGQSVRLRAALQAAADEGAVEILYENATDELRDVLEEASFFRFLGPDGGILLPPGSTSMSGTEGLSTAWKGLQHADQQTGFLVLPTSSGPELQEVIASKIVHPLTDDTLGALVLAFPVPELAPRERPAVPDDQVASPALREDTMLMGFFLGGRLFARPEIDSTVQPGVVEDRLRRATADAPADGDFQLTFGFEPYRFFYRATDPASALPTAYQVSMYSLAEERRDQRQLRRAVLGFAALGLAGAFALATVLSHGLAIPIRELVAATTEVGRGNLSVQVPVRSADELGRLAHAFNDMTLGLAQKERYRNLLNLVADESVAEQLLSGTTVALGGERRDVTVLFCDIRGFTELTRPMPPEEVIDMLNEHMTTLTRVIKEHGGVVDKFVGDCVMAIFGAPLSHGDDAVAAARCAVRMIDERERENRTARYVLRVGIGLATGPVVAGCMGSADRLNYTVVGERVNLASRLCACAGPMEIVIDSSTRARLPESAVAEALPALRLKGFGAGVPAFRLVKWS
ncbi:MAG: adenylate/guanylate cyclase domain-containing protein [Acidobacteria bacterium]|nr:adenylate/guanylate cyclase domain-containing protein [Acidobacteriota bacterium]